MEAAFQQGFASALLDVLFNRVTDVFLIELKKIKYVAEAVEKLETTILKVPELLRKVDVSRFQGNDDLMRVLQKRTESLTTLCYDAEDVMDEIALIITKHNSESGKKWRVRDAILRSFKTWTIPHGINKLQEKITSILDQLRDLTETIPGGCCNLKSQISSIEDENYVKKIPLLGRVNDVQDIIEELKLCGGNNGVSILGMVGLGKTALARTVMNDASIIEEFPVRLWVHVLKGSFNKKETIERLANYSPSLVKVEFGSQESSSNNLVLKQRKHLIILDNLCEVKHLDWDDFWSDVKDRGETKLLITSRDPKISKLTGTSPYYLKPLSKKSCKEVIIEKASSHQKELSGPKFSRVADILASSCEGLPLVARIIGLVLAKCDEDKWETLFNRDLWEWPVFEDEILPLLTSSYHDMKSDMKKCFAFLSLFPHNYRFNIDDLVQLWVAAGFIQQTQGRSSSLEKLGHDHFNFLLGRSILQSCHNVTHIEIPTFELHKVNHKFAQVAASKACMRLDEGVSFLSVNNDTRHLSLLCENINPTVWSQMKSLKHLCTILSLYAHNKIGRLGRIPPNLFKTIERLRVLALSNTDVVEVPDSIDRLKHLRYLDVSSTLIEKLPETLSKLHSLQILKFGNTRKLSRLPKDLQNLINLLYLDWDVSNIEHLGLPRNIGNLANLQNLPLFAVGQKEGCSIVELQNLNSLQCSIRIKKLENVKDGNEAKTAMLHKKSSLQRIELQCNTSTKDSISRDVLEGLKPHNSLKELKITRYGCVVFPQWISDPSLRLQKIHLQRCRSCNILPPLGQLFFLKVLILEDMSNLKSADTSLPCPPSYSTVELFPSLEILEFTDMPELQGWRGLEANAMLRLRKLKLIDCPKMVDLPSLENLTSLVDVQIERCQALESLPELPTSLKSLVIRSSPMLIEQCQVGGKERFKIDLVPDVEINYKKIPKSDECISNLFS